MSSLARALLDAWLPPRCVAWDEPLGGAEGPWCAAAEGTLERAEPGFDAPTDSWASFGFGGALRDALVAAKYRPDERRGRRLAGFWATHLRAHPPELFEALGSSEGGPLVVSFVPAHWRRRLWRGFDLAPLLADAVGEVLGAPVVDLLTCDRHEAPLSAAESKEERAARAGGRYALRHSIAGGTVVLVDDVVTTGATLSAARAPLEAAGVTVHTLALARTP